MTNVECPVTGCNQDHVPNLPLLRKVISQITDHPETWDQSNWTTVLLPEMVSSDDTFDKPLREIEQQWTCQSAFCIAGHAAVLSGAEPILAGPVQDHLGEQARRGVEVRFDYDRVTQGYAVPIGNLHVAHCARTADGQELPISTIAFHELGLTDEETNLLFDGDNELVDIRFVCNEIAARAGEEF